jgi:glycosyltransferase involved in cell wall biosynthesis
VPSNRDIEPRRGASDGEPISVVMPVHNALPHLDAAVRSILDQTYRNFEFVIFDDGSTDGSLQRLRYWAAKDERIRLIESRTNLGPVGSSNRVAEAAKAKLVARMDADDVSHPERLERQVAVMLERSDVALVASTCDIIGPEGEKIRGADTWRLARSSWFSPFAHGSILYRRDIFETVGGYRSECEFWEDQDLFVRMLAFTDKAIVVLKDALYSNRHSAISTRVSVSRERVEQAVDLAYRCVNRLDRQQWYDDLLIHKKTTPKVDPSVFISHGSLRLWANERPREFERLLERGRLSLDIGTISALVWTLWASASPGSLRAFMKGLAALRNRSLSPDDLPDAVEWVPPHRAEVSAAASRSRASPRN